MAACAQRALWYGELLARDIPAECFALQPHPGMNHPAFIFGHLSLYSSLLLPLVGRGEAAANHERPAWQALFGAGAACVGDPHLYPPKDELVGAWLAGYRAVVEGMQTMDDSRLLDVNPIERMREKFPQLGTALNFLINNHQMTHLGQLSAWRRARGMGPVF